MTGFFTPLARSLPATVPFVGPEAIERRTGVSFKARLGANESVFGPSPRAVAAMREAASGSWAYGDPELFELRRAIARHHGLPAETISVGEGIDGLLGLIVRLTCEAGEAVVSSRGAYPTFNFHVAGFGAALDLVPYRNDAEDPQALAERAARLRPKLLYFANPDNPTGSWHEADTVERLIHAVPEETLLLLDEAYTDLAPPSSRVPETVIRRNLLRLRTFSKGYGMAGVRIGYAIGDPETIAGFDKVRNHFGISRISQAGALAAIRDQAYLAEVTERVSAGRERLAGIARAAGLTPLPSATNFVAMDCGTAERASAILDAVIAQGVFIRKPGVAPLDRLIRVTVGREHDLDLFETALLESVRQADALERA